MDVGVRELRNRLSRYLKRVRAGETITVTDRGRPVARIIPAGTSPHIARLMAEGKVTWSGKPFRPPKRSIKLGPGPPLSEYIVEDREAGF